MPTNDERHRSPMVEPAAGKKRADTDDPVDPRRKTAKEPFPETAPWQTPQSEK
ncbi:hypothetical protein ACFQ49_15405 [Kroppenstedtia eburnea]|uniref:hypothetical protein n=1 Tax=Kroppenstedtia eburnea TaxID=714067 RepID=UPI00020C8931|nr:hypothetical protein HMPREF9374_3182 [Desmospora sp. 8437]